VKSEKCDHTIVNGYFEDKNNAEFGLFFACTG
jgi:hypothetical protein